MREPLTTISLTPSVRDRIKSLKRGGESYSELLLAMADQYESDQKDN